MKSVVIFFGVLLFSITGLSAQQNYRSLMHSGNQSFKKKNFAKAASIYLQAIKEKKDDFAAHYNLGNALYRQKMYEDAEAQYSKAEKLTKNKTDKASALYNRGNALMQKNNSEEAAKLYRNALKLDPYNETIRKNYQIAMLKEKEKDQQKQNQKNGGGGGGEQQKGGQDDKKGQSQSNGNSGNQNDGTNGQGNQPKDHEQGSGNNLPKELEKAILKKSGEREKETSRRILNKDAYSMPRSNEKDW